MDAQVERKRRENEKKFGTWEELPNGGRRYSYEVKGHHNWIARYVKEVDTMEQTLRFYQTIYDGTASWLKSMKNIPKRRDIEKSRIKIYENFS